MGLHVGHMTGRDEMRACFDAVTVNGATALALDGYGIAPGCRADLVVLQCRDELEALRLKPARLFVVRAGRVIARTPAVTPVLALDAGEQAVELGFEPGGAPPAGAAHANR